jgi:hypothetical protein
MAQVASRSWSAEQLNRRSANRAGMAATEADLDVVQQTGCKTMH